MDLDNKIYEKFISKLSYSEYIGVEIELPIINILPPYTIEMDVIQKLLESIKKLNFNTSNKDNDNNIIALKNVINGDTISLEYSCNTLEISLNKEKDVFTLEKKFKKYTKYINSFLKEYNYKLEYSGINSNYKEIEKKCLNHNRYKIIEKLLLTKEEQLYSEFCSYCCSIQTHINVDKDNLIKVLNCFTTIEDIKDNIFANSYMKETGIKNSRKFLWINSNFKPNNVGKNILYKDISDLINDYKNRCLFYIERQNKFMLLKNKTSLNKYFTSKKISVIDENNHKHLIKPMTKDFENFRSYKSVELTKYGTLEIRTDCTQNKNNIFKLVAFNVGISLSAKDILEYLKREKNINEQDLISFAIKGLKKRNKNEEKYLEDL